MRRKQSSAWDMQDNTLTVGKVARLAGVSADTVRFYEKEGLLAPAGKSAAGYRLYGQEAVRQLRFIRHAQDCGFSLAEAHELLTLRASENACCTDVRSVAVQKKLLVEGKIKALQVISQALNDLIARCEGGDLPLDACPILATLDANEPRRQASEEG